jgi:hypothetical protein
VPQWCDDWGRLATIQAREVGGIPAGRSQAGGWAGG